MIPIQPAALSDEGAVDEAVMRRLGAYVEHRVFPCHQDALTIRVSTWLRVSWCKLDGHVVVINHLDDRFGAIGERATVARLCHLLIALGTATLTSEVNRE